LSFAGKISTEKIMQPLNYSKVCFYKIVSADLDALDPQLSPLLGENCYSRAVDVGIDEPACQVCFEDFFPGGEYHWTTWIDQIDFVTQGKAEVTILQPPDLEEQVTVIAEAPCIYLIPRGARVVWKVLGDEVFRHFSVDVPNPGFRYPTAKSIQKS
jgi:hypothetical protein